MALTFDDGPDPRFTPLVLDLLEELDVRATFFVVGERVDAYPHLVRRMAVEGHAVGSHSHSHPDTRRLGWSTLMAEYGGGRRKAEEATGCSTRLFRPPNGYINTRGAAAIRAAGLTTWLWSIDGRDWVAGAKSSAIVAAVDGLTAGDVVLLHDGAMNPVSVDLVDRSATVEALPAIVELARRRNLGLTTLGAG